MQTIYIDISNKGMIQPVYAKQGDIGRKFVAVFMENGGRYNIPSGSMFSAWYKGSSGEGNYTDVGEKSAFSIANNRVIVELISEMLGVPGEGFICLVLTKSDGGQIGSWNIPYICEEVPGFGSEEVTQYFTAFSKALEDIRSNPENIHIDNSLSIGGAAADSLTVGERLRPLDGNFSPKFVIGDLQVSGNEFTFNETLRTRISTVLGTTYAIPNGTSFSLSDYTETKMLVVYYSYNNGISYTSYTCSANKPTFVVTQNALVALKIVSSVSQTDTSLSNLLVVDIPLLSESLDSHINNTENPHKVTASQLGLGNVNNTSDMDKPVSTAQAEVITRVNENAIYAISLITEINKPSKSITDATVDFDSVIETGDYTVTSDGNPNNPILGLYRYDRCKLYVRADGFNRYTQFVHPLRSNSYAYGKSMRLFMRIGDLDTTNNPRWGAWAEIITSDNINRFTGWGVGKTIVNIGDSIFGNYDSQSISQYLTQFSGAAVHNCGFGGTRVVPRGESTVSLAPFDFGNLATAICTGDWSKQEAQIGNDGIPALYATRIETIKSVDFSSVDVLTIAYGTNDWAMGSYLSDTNDATPLASVISTLEAGIKQINKTYPQMKIVLICPIWRLWNGEDSDVKSYGTGTLEEFSAEYEKLSKKLKIPYLDAYHNLTFNNDNRAVFYAETAESSTHLNATGRKVYAELIDGKLKTLF